MKKMYNLINKENKFLVDQITLNMYFFFSIAASSISRAWWKFYKLRFVWKSDISTFRERIEKYVEMLEFDWKYYFTRLRNHRQQVSEREYIDSIFFSENFINICDNKSVVYSRGIPTHTVCMCMLRMQTSYDLLLEKRVSKQMMIQIAPPFLF